MRWEKKYQEVLEALENLRQEACPAMEQDTDRADVTSLLLERVSKMEDQLQVLDRKVRELEELHQRLEEEEQERYLEDEGIRFPSLLGSEEERACISTFERFFYACVDGFADLLEKECAWAETGGRVPEDIPAPAPGKEPCLDVHPGYDFSQGAWLNLSLRNRNGLVAGDSCVTVTARMLEQLTRSNTPEQLQVAAFHFTSEEMDELFPREEMRAFLCVQAAEEIDFPRVDWILQERRDLAETLQQEKDRQDLPYLMLLVGHPEQLSHATKRLLLHDVRCLRKLGFTLLLVSDGAPLKNDLMAHISFSILGSDPIGMLKENPEDTELRSFYTREPEEKGENMEQERIARVREMEDRLNRITAWLESGAEETEALREDVGLLEEYYQSPLWREDFEADEAGEFPADLPRGVLSEDGIYNVLEAYGERTRENTEEKRGFRPEKPGAGV